MIQVAYRYADGHELTVTGHAGAAPKGEDLVCAAVTILLRSLAWYMEHTQSAQVDIADGSFTLLSDGDMGADGMGALNMAFAGLDLLAQQYPEFVNITIFE